MKNTPLLELHQIHKTYQTNNNWLNTIYSKKTKPAIHALDDISLQLSKGEVVGLVGESGCGKSTLGKIAAGLEIPTAGELRWQGKIFDAKNIPLQQRLKLQMIFQDASSALNPRMKVIDLIGEAPLVHHLIEKQSRHDYVSGLLEKVGLNQDALHRYPHQFSGGQRARLGIARALAVNPELLICDESVAALDVSIQAQVLNLFMDLREQLNLTYLFISHDLGVIQHISDRVIVMYLGKIVEQASVEELFSHPAHPYTQALISQTPSLDTSTKKFISIKGEIPSPINRPDGCFFHTRCPHAMPRCKIERPNLIEIAPTHFAACHLTVKSKEHFNAININLN